MANDIVAPVAVTPAPVTATPAPAAPAAADAAPAPAPVAVAAPAPAVPVAEAAPPTPALAAAEPTSILSDAVAAKPAEPVAPAVVTPGEAAPPAPIAPPTYESFKLPDGVTLDATRVSEFQTKLGQFEIESKADHAKMQQFGQSMVDLFVAEQQRSQTALVESFNQIRADWRTAIQADPNFGGQNMKATTAAAGAFIEQYGGTPEEVAEIRKVFRITGAGDNPAMIKLFARAGKATAQEGRPVPAVVPKSPTSVPKSQRRYGNSLNGNGAS